MIRENFKKVGVFNTVLIILVVIYDSLRLVTGNTLLPKISIAIHFGAYIAGILYAVSGYKKDAAKYYKVFMLFLVVSEILSFVSKMDRSEPPMFSMILSGICVFAALILFFVKDFGKKNTIAICSMSLILHISNLLYTLINASAKFQAATGPISDSILLIVALVFIVAKYEDKASRGSN